MMCEPAQVKIQISLCTHMAAAAPDTQGSVDDRRQRFPERRSVVAAITSRRQLCFLSNPNLCKHRKQLNILKQILEQSER